MTSIQHQRAAILRMVMTIGKIAKKVTDGDECQGDTAMGIMIKKKMELILDVAIAFDIDLYTVCQTKINMNNAKYPADLCNTDISK